MLLLQIIIEIWMHAVSYQFSEYVTQLQHFSVLQLTLRMEQRRTKFKPEFMMELVNRIGRYHLKHSHDDRFSESSFWSIKIGHIDIIWDLFLFYHRFDHDQLEPDGIRGVFRWYDQRTWHCSTSEKEERSLFPGGLEFISRSRWRGQGKGQREVCAKSWWQNEIFIGYRALDTNGTRSYS